MPSGACGRVVGELSLGAPLWLPPRRPRALAVEVRDESGALLALKGDVLNALAAVSVADLAAERAGAFGPT